MGLRSSPSPGHDLIEALVELQAIARQLNVTGDAIQLPNPPQAHGSGGAGIGGVALDDQNTACEAILTQVVGDACPDNAAPDQYHICCLRHGSLPSSSAA